MLTHWSNVFLALNHRYILYFRLKDGCQLGEFENSGCWRSRRHCYQTAWTEWLHLEETGTRYAGSITIQIKIQIPLLPRINTHIGFCTRSRRILLADLDYRLHIMWHYFFVLCVCVLLLHTSWFLFKHYHQVYIVVLYSFVKGGLGNGLLPRAKP